MNEDEAEAVRSLLDPLLRALEMLLFISRNLHPPDFEELMASVGMPDEELKSALARPLQWPQRPPDIGTLLGAACDAALGAFAGLRKTLQQSGDVRDVYRALRLLPKGLEALYPLAAVLPPVNRFFLDPSLRSDAAVQARFLGAPAQDDTGVMQFGEKERGGFWLYVPENYVRDRAWPLVTALHGGSGTGRQFLWSWLRDARSRGAIVVAPTSVGSTWALMGPDADTPNLRRILEMVRSRWNVDATRLLLTGMSDGGTFSYVSGLEAGSPFTHLAPVSAAFHPMLAQMAEADRHTRAADPHHSWSPRLDVSRGVGAASAQGAVEGRCRRDVSGGRGSQPLLSPRAERSASEVAGNDALCAGMTALAGLGTDSATRATHGRRRIANARRETANRRCSVLRLECRPASGSSCARG